MTRLILPVLACVTVGLYPWGGTPLWVERLGWVVQGNYGMTTEDYMLTALTASPWLWLIFAFGEGGADEDDAE
jgi:hypothetical protein